MRGEDAEGGSAETKKMAMDQQYLYSLLPVCFCQLLKLISPLSFFFPITPALLS